MASGPTVDGIDLGALNYTEQVPYNGTIPTGGNSLTNDLNVYYDVCLTPYSLTYSTLREALEFWVICFDSASVLTRGRYIGW